MLIKASRDKLLIEIMASHNYFELIVFKSHVTKMPPFSLMCPIYNGVG